MIPVSIPKLLDQLLDAVFCVDVDGCVVYVNAACESILGYAPDEMLGRQILDFVHPDDQDSTLKEIQTIRAGSPRIGFENRYIRKDGRLVHLMWSARWVEDSGLRVGVARDITERKLAAERQAALYRLAQAAHVAPALEPMFATFHEVFAQLLQVGGMVALADGGRRMVYSASSPGHPVLRLATAGWHAVPISGPGAALGEMRLALAPGRPLSAADKELLQYAATQAAAVIERRLLHADLEYAARYDELTGLPNRRLFQDRIRSAFARCRRGQSAIALLFVDLDDFKAVNDAHGHGVGDLFLKAVARRVTACIREVDTVARLGGDEFVVLLEDVHGPDDAHAVADKIRATFLDALDLEDGKILPVQVSLGVAVYPRDGDDVDTLLRHADQAMYADKAGRKAPPR